MPKIARECLCFQDTVHLLAKLRTRLITPSNLLVMGTETACRVHLEQLVHRIPKDRHGLTLRCISQKDKQNYDSITSILKLDVVQCVKDEVSELRPDGTISFLRLMRDIRDAFFKKSISPLERAFLIWRTIFFAEYGQLAADEWVWPKKPLHNSQLLRLPWVEWPCRFVSHLSFDSKWSPLFGNAPLVIRLTRLWTIV